MDVARGGGCPRIGLVRRWLSLAPIVVIILGLGAASASAASNDTVVVSRSPGAGPPDANANITFHSISGDGRLVAFQSAATNLSPNDTDATLDVLVRDVQTNTTTLVSRASAPGDAKGNGNSFAPAISADGRFVAFPSSATNLVPNDTNGQRDIFLRDLQSGATTRVSVATDGTTQGDGVSVSPEISADGRFVVFQSAATNLVAGDTNGVRDIFVRDLLTGTTTRVSVASDGTQAADQQSSDPSISADGRFVSFDTGAPLVSDDTNNGADVFVRDRQTNMTTRVSVASDGSQATQVGGGFAPSGGSSLSADGRFVAFGSAGNNLVPNDTNDRVDVFVKDRQTNAITLVSRAVGDDPSADSDSFLRARSISADGRRVAFESGASNLVTGDNNNARDVFVRDLEAETTAVASRSSGAGPPDATGGDAGGPSLSADGRFVSFASGATNLVAGDTNGFADIFRRELAPPSADLSLAAIAAPDPVTAGQNLTYTLTATNRGGPNVARAVTLADSLPGGVTYRSASASQGTCTPSTDGRSVTCDLGDLPRDATASVTIVVTANQPGTVANTASVSGSLTDPDTSNNAATTTTTVTAPPPSGNPPGPTPPGGTPGGSPTPTGPKPAARKGRSGLAYTTRCSRRGKTKVVCITSIRVLLAKGTSREACSGTVRVGVRVQRLVTVARHGRKRRVLRTANISYGKQLGRDCRVTGRADLARLRLRGHPKVKVHFLGNRLVHGASTSYQRAS